MARRRVGERRAARSRAGRDGHASSLRAGLRAGFTARGVRYERLAHPSWNRRLLKGFYVHDNLSERPDDQQLVLTVNLQAERRRRDAEVGERGADGEQVVVAGGGA